MSYEDRYDDEGNFLRSNFADPGGRSALRAASRTNPRNRPCPRCGRKNVLTPADVARHYVCDHCADAAERGLDY
jgi:ribosomal protein S27AE